jgi:hypothetical protein
MLPLTLFYLILDYYSLLLLFNNNNNILLDYLPKISTSHSTTVSSRPVKGCKKKKKLLTWQHHRRKNRHWWSPRKHLTKITYVPHLHPTLQLETTFDSSPPPCSFPPNTMSQDPRLYNVTSDANSSLCWYWQEAINNTFSICPLLAV